MSILTDDGDAGGANSSKQGGTSRFHSGQRPSHVGKVLGFEVLNVKLDPGHQPLEAWVLLHHNPMLPQLLYRGSQIHIVELGQVGAAQGQDLFHR